jgi:GNAT superfamily N-acetyltransferase
MGDLRDCFTPSRLGLTQADTSFNLEEGHALPAPDLRMVRTGDRPDLIPTVVDWLWEAFWRPNGHPLELVRDLVAASVAEIGPPQTFVLLADGAPVGTAALVAHDLDERPDLTPWLAGVFVAPEARGRGYAALLIAAVEAASRAAAIPTLWLYTNTAEHIYRRAGWHAIETFERRGKSMTLMRRDL